MGLMNLEDDRMPWHCFLVPIDFPALRMVVEAWNDPDTTINHVYKWPKLHFTMFKHVGHPDRPGPLQRIVFLGMLKHDVSKLVFKKLTPRSQDIGIYWCCKIMQ